MDVESTARNLGIGQDELLALLEIFLEASWADFQALEAGDGPRAAWENRLSGASGQLAALMGKLLELTGAVSP